MAAPSGCGDNGQHGQAVADLMNLDHVDYGPNTLTFRRGSSWDEAEPDLHTVLAGITSQGGWVATPHN